MKKPVTIFALCTLLFALWATLFAQTTTGSSLITQMKATVHAFTLAGDLNPGVTGLESSPLVGKRTGDMLSAGEYNRLLELVGQGGGGAGWVDVPLTDTADFDVKCDYIFNWLRATFVHPEIIWFIKNEFDATSAASWYAVRKANKNTMINHQDNYANNTIYPTQAITSITKNCGGGGTAGWETLSEQTYNNPSLRDVSGAGPYSISCTKTDAAYYCGMHGSVLVSMTCKDVGINLVIGANYNSGQWSADDHYVAGGANRGIDVLKCANGIGAITDVRE